MAGVEDHDRGWKHIADSFRAAKGGMVVHIGVQGIAAGERNENEGVTNVELALIHEFGTPDNKPPERSFIRSSFDDHKKEYAGMLKAGSERILEGKLDIEQVVGVVGEKVLADIKQKINDGIDPPNADSTIARKGSSTPLIDTAQMKNSLTMIVVDEKTSNEFENA